MALVGLPEELLGIKWDTSVDEETGFVTRKLPDNATPEQKKAYKEYLDKCIKAQNNMVVIEE